VRIRKDKGITNSPADHVETNRISGIEESYDNNQKWGKNKKGIFILLLSTIAILTILIIVNLIYKKPGNFIETTKSKLMDNILSGSDSGKSNNKIDHKTENALLQKAVNDYKNGYTANAITGFNSVVESDANEKDKAIALLYLGIIADEEGKYSNAIDFFNRGINYDKENHLLYLNRAKTYRKMKNYDLAVDNAEKSKSIKTTADSAILLGNIYFEKGNFDEALKNYQEALKIDKNNAIVLYNMAIALFRKGERFPALEYLKKAAEADQIGEIAFKSYSRLGTEFLSTNMLDLAENYLKKAVSLSPNDPATRYNLSLLYLKRGNQAQAIKELEESERLGQENKKLLENIGETYYSLNDYDKSIRVYEKILETDKRNVRILSRIGEIYYKNGKLEQAYNAFKKITATEPATENSRVSYLNMGNILDDMGKFDDAIKAYESALAINSKDDQTYYNMGVTYKNSDKPELAISSWRKALKINPDNIKAKMSMGDYYFEKGHIDMAEKTYQDVIYKWKDNEEALFKLGTIYHKQKNYKDAEEAYRRVINLNRNSDFTKNSYVNLAMILTNQSKSEADLDSSLSLLKKALLMKPGDPDALLALGIVYAEKSMHEKAIETFYQVIKSTRDSGKIGESYNNIGKNYYKLKKYQKSIEAFTRGIENSPTSEELRINRKTAVQAYEKELSRVR